MSELTGGQPVLIDKTCVVIFASQFKPYGSFDVKTAEFQLEDISMTIAKGCKSADAIPDSHTRLQKVCDRSNTSSLELLFAVVVPYPANIR